MGSVAPSGPSSSLLRLRLLGLALLVVLPALGLLALTAKQDRDALSDQIEAGALRLARLASSEHERGIEGARQLLTGLARIDELRATGRVCNVFLADLLKRFTDYANFGVVDLRGDVICSAVPPHGTVSAADRSWFRGAITTKDFTIGDFQIGRITRQPTLNLGYPIADENGATISVVFGALALGSFDRVAQRADLPDGSSVIVIDGAGTILTRFPDPARWIGRSVPEQPLARAMLTRRDGTADVAGVDGVRRMYGFARLRGGGSVSVAVGVPTATAFAQVDSAFRNTLVGLGVVALLALVGAWIVGTVFIVRPVTRAFDLEHRARERLEQLDQTRSDFMSLVSHDLRNPMATIRGFGQILRDQPELLQGAQRQEAYDVIVRQVDRMASLVDNVLDVSRIESDTFTYAFVPYDLRELLDEAVAEARAAWPGRPILLDATAARAVGDRDRTKQVLGNLLSNACRYSPEDAEVVLRARADGSQLRIDVVDRGAGIDPADQERLFQRFTRAPGRGGVRGTGLGLYISRRIVEAHGGRISIDSEPGRGSTFTVTLPVEASGEGSGEAGPPGSR